MHRTEIFARYTVAKRAALSATTPFQRSSGSILAASSGRPDLEELRHALKIGNIEEIPRPRFPAVKDLKPALGPSANLGG